MNRAPSRMVCIACSIFQSELQALQTRGDLNRQIRYLNSMLHLDPAKLHRLLDPILMSETEQGNQVLLLFGDCHPLMTEQESIPGVGRVRGINCPEVLLGRDEYRSLRRQGVFFLLPEWTLRWREIFQSGLGLNREVAESFMREMHTKLLYLDTGWMPVPREQLEAISDYAGLPWEVMRVGPDHLLAAIHEAAERIAEHEHRFQFHEEKTLASF